MIKFGESFENDFEDSEPIMDSIYGIIKISAFEKRLINTKEMQRLRGIKQLGFVNLVYPDAEHSRFSHSVGVCHQAKTLADQVSKNILSSKRYKNWRNKFVSRENVSEIYQITEIERIVIAAAALLHDLPHSPFSHEIENSIRGKEIFIHDDYQHNSTFFEYLFNKSKSDIASIIDIYNESFWQKVKSDKKWGSRLQLNKSIDNTGYYSIANKIKVPLLGAMIFEIMLFDKMHMWLKEDNHTPNDNGVEIAIDEGNKVKWFAIENWFRPYRKDIIANTICADLLDYLQRDGRNTGILSSLDLKFFDRMTIAKAIPERTSTLVSLNKIPDFCEHIVFDIYDHKRGIIRQSVITEIISFLQQRYLLSERVYEHRVVEGARTMLREASHLLSEKHSLKAKLLHTINSNGSSPINDEAFLSWVLDVQDSNVETKKAKQLIKMLHERRIFREVVIIDGILGNHKGTYRGSDVDCRTLADVLLDDEKRSAIITKLNKEIAGYCKEYKIEQFPSNNSEILFTVGVRKWGKRYKIPRVLVARPLNHDQDDDIEIFPLFEGKKLPAINDRLESMQHAYNSLWKVYLFIHPFFHHKQFVKLHEQLAKTFVESLYAETNIRWKNSIENYNDLLPEHPIDIVAFKGKHSIELHSDNLDFLGKIISLINNVIPEDEFKLGESSRKAMKSKLNKGIPIIFKDIQLQQKIVDQISSFSIGVLPKAARDREEFIIDKLVAFIKGFEDGNRLL